MAVYDYTHPYTYGEVLPGYELLRTSKEHPLAPAGSWLLVCGNEIIARSSIDPVSDPFFGEGELEERDGTAEEQAAFCEHMKVADELGGSLLLNPLAGYELITAAMAVGYNPGVHGRNFASWLTHLIAERIAATAPAANAGWLG